LLGILAWGGAVSCQGYEEPDGNDACQEAGYAIANRTVTCGGDRDTGNERYRSLFRQYTCIAQFGVYVDPVDSVDGTPPAPVPNQIPPGAAFGCSVAIRQISCDQASRNGDSIASWLGAAPTCGQIFSGPGLGAGGAGGQGG
jgi:hypothetical protein